MSNIIKLKPTKIVERLSPSESQLTVRKFLDSNGNEVNYSDYGNTPFILTVIQGKESESILCNGLVRADDGTVEISIATNGREISDTPPYEGQTTGKNFLVGALVVATNDPHTLSQFLKKDANGTLTGDYIFTGKLFHTGNNSDSNSVMNRATIEAMITSLNIGSSAVIYSGATAGAENIPANTVCKMNTATGVIEVATNTDTTIDETTVLVFNRSAVLAGQTAIAGVILSGKTGLTGLVIGKKYLGIDGAVANTGDIYIGMTGDDGVFILDGEVLKESLIKAQMGYAVAGLNKRPEQGNEFLLRSMVEKKTVGSVVTYEARSNFNSPIVIKEILNKTSFKVDGDYSNLLKIAVEGTSGNFNKTIDLYPTVGLLPHLNDTEVTGSFVAPHTGSFTFNFVIGGGDIGRLSIGGGTLYSEGTHQKVISATAGDLIEIKRHEESGGGGVRQLVSISVSYPVGVNLIDVLTTNYSGGETTMTFASDLPENILYAKAVTEVIVNKTYPVGLLPNNLTVDVINDVIDASTESKNAVISVFTDMSHEVNCQITIKINGVTKYTSYSAQGYRIAVGELAVGDILLVQVYQNSGHSWVHKTTENQLQEHLYPKQFEGGVVSPQ